MGYFYSDEELAHHGILGQKWGVRRYQNKDGSLTSAGRSDTKMKMVRLMTLVRNLLEKTSGTKS